MNDDWRIPGRPMPQADPNRDWRAATAEERGAELERFRREYCGDAACDAPMAKAYLILRKDENGVYQIVKGNF